MRLKVWTYGLVFFGLFIINSFAFASNNEIENHDEPKKLRTDSYSSTEIIDHTNVPIVEGREYHFFNDDVFECEFFKSVVSEDDFLYINNNPILRAYFILIYPASSWLDDESLYILEIL